jgi:predicted ribonuclease toxin of YeeF-YezG toxin-antitoxin module
MTIKAIIKKYKTLHPKTDVKQKGSWIQINGCSFRSKDVLKMIDEYESAVDTVIESKAIAIKPATATEILSSYDDVGMLAKTIHMKADSIRHTSKLSDAIKAGHDIVKLAKRIMNLTEV